MLSYWEKKNFIQHDLLVVGGGFVGLSTAVHYKKRFPNRSVMVLERGTFPSGASTRNAGFACFGSLTEILDDIEHSTETEVLGLIQKRLHGLTSIRQEFGDMALDYYSLGGYELIRKEEEDVLGQLDRINDLLKPLVKEKVFRVLSSIQHFGFSEKVNHLIQNPWEGQLDPGKYIQCLWEVCRDLDIKILTGVMVDEVDERGRVRSHDLNGERIEWRSGQVAICTNAFTKRLLPDLELEPGRGMIMLSQPIPDFPWKGTFHFDKGFVYFRDVDGRLLIGGGRNVALEEENTAEQGINPKIKDYLEDLVKDMVFPKKEVQWEMEWSGTMAFGKIKIPIVKMVNSRVGVAARLGGMGVAMGWEVGKELAELIGH